MKRLRCYVANAYVMMYQPFKIATRIKHKTYSRSKTTHLGIKSGIFLPKRVLNRRKILAPNETNSELAEADSIFD